MKRLRPEQRSLLAARLTAQGLAGDPAAGPLEVTRKLLAVQAQDPRGARLAIRARSASAYASDLDRALTEERSLVITWVNRGTLHLIAAEDEPLLHALTTPQLRTGSDRRLAQEGVSPAALDRGIDAIVAALGADGPMTRDRLRGVLDAIGVPTARQALVHILYRATLDGLIVRGPMVGSEHAFVLRADWLGARQRVDRDRALAELARRYLVGHGPADDRDLAKWAQLPLRDARVGLSAIASELRRATGRAGGHPSQRPRTTPRAPAAGTVRSAATRLVLARAGARRRPGRRHDQRHLQVDRAGRRTRRRHVVDAGRPRRAVAVGAAEPDRRRGAAAGRRRRGVVPVAGAARRGVG